MYVLFKNFIRKSKKSWDQWNFLSKIFNLVYLAYKKKLVYQKFLFLFYGKQWYMSCCLRLLWHSTERQV